MTDTSTSIPTKIAAPANIHADSMRAIVQREYGSADVLRSERVERPEIAGALDALIERYDAQAGEPAANAPLAPDLVESLRALGYLEDIEPGAP